MIDDSYGVLEDNENLDDHIVFDSLQPKQPIGLESISKVLQDLNLLQPVIIDKYIGLNVEVKLFLEGQSEMMKANNVEKRDMKPTRVVPKIGDRNSSVQSINSSGPSGYTAELTHEPGSPTSSSSRRLSDKLHSISNDARR